MNQVSLQDFGDQTGQTIGSNEYVPRRTLDDGLVGYMAVQELKEVNQNNPKQFFDNNMVVQQSINMVTSPQPISGSTRAITWNAPALDRIWRRSPYVTRAVDWLSSKLFIKGIDINTHDEAVLSKELDIVQQEIKNLYPSLQKMAENGYVYGGGALLKIIRNKKSKQDLEKPLNIKDIKKGDFEGLRYLARWYQIEPALDYKMIQLEDIGEETGITDANLIGTPMYYRVNLSGGLVGYSGRNDQDIKGSEYKPQGDRLLVHKSWLYIFNPYSLSHIETQIERYWSSSIIEKASVDMERHEIIWSATAKSAVKNNIGIVNIHGYDSTILNEHSKKVMNDKIETMKYTTNHGLLVFGEKDKFAFAQSSLVGNEKAIEQSKKQIATAFGVPVNVLFGENEPFDEETYMQSLFGVENTQEKIVRPIFIDLIKIVYKSQFGKMIKSFYFDFKPIITLSQKSKAEVMNIMIEVLTKAHEAGFISTIDGINMLNDLGNNPSNIFHQLSEDYIDMIKKGAEDGTPITANWFKIELAKALNQFQNKGLSGVESPESSTGRVNKGGDPTKSTKVLPRHSLNKQKGKE